MEGGLLIHAAWALSFTFVWVYRRWFEKVAARNPEFERFCRERPMVAALLVERGTETQALAALRALVPRGETVATLGAFPWVHYALRVECASRRGVISLSVAGCRVLRTREAPPPALGTVLARLSSELGAGAVDTWLHPRACIDVSGRVKAEHGWRLGATPGERPSFSARDEPLTIAA